MRGPQREVRVAEHLAAEHHGVRAALGDDGLGLRRLGDEAHGVERDLRVLLHVLGEGHLVAGRDGDRDPGRVAARGDVEEVGAVLGGPAGDRRGLLLVPAGVARPVGRGEAHQQRHVGDLGAHGVDHLEQQARPVLQAAAELVVAVVAQRREELVHEVAVRGVDLEHVESGVDRAAGGRGEVVDDLPEARGVERDGRAVTGERLGRRGDRLPAALLGGHGAAAGERVGGCLAAGVRELDGRDRAHLVDEVDDRLPRVALRVIPDARVLGRDARLGADPGGLRHHESRAAAGERAEVREVPGARHAVAGVDAVLAHRRDPDAVAGGDAADGDRLEERGRGHGDPSRRAAARILEGGAARGDGRRASEASWSQGPARPPHSRAPIVRA